MRITAATLQMGSTSHREERVEVAVMSRSRERLVASPAAAAPLPAAGAVAERTGTAHQRVAPAAPPREVEAAQCSEKNERCPATLTPTMRLLKMLLDRLFGIEVALLDPKALEIDDPALELPPAPTATASRRTQEGVWIERTTVLEATATVVKTEALTFAASGVVRTADGRTIEFAAGFALQRSERTSLSVTLGVATSIEPRRKDPLVIDFAGPAAELVDIGFHFDLLGNGEKINLPAPTRGLGYLVFDRNGNGRVDDGRELFGPATGDGFQELAALDEDRNGWIDEGDRAFAALYVWHPFAPERLIALKDADIGALAVNAVATPWTVANQNGHVGGELRKTSIYLKESGGVGTVSHLDLLV